MTDLENPSGQTPDAKESQEAKDEQTINNFAEQILAETDNLRNSCHKKILESDNPQLFAAVRRLSGQHPDLKAGSMVDITGEVQNACHRILHGDAPCLTSTTTDGLAGHLDFNRFWITLLNLDTQQASISLNITVPFGG